MTDKRSGFSKSEKLCSHSVISKLLEEGNSFFCYPFTVIWMPENKSSRFPVQLAISVPRKSFKKAVHRNKIKRLVREAWRKNKHDLYSILEQQNYQLVIMLIYNGKDIPAYEKLVKAINTMISKFTDVLADAINKDLPD